MYICYSEKQHWNVVVAKRSMVILKVLGDGMNLQIYTKSWNLGGSGDKSHADPARTQDCSWLMSCRREVKQTRCDSAGQATGNKILSPPQHPRSSCCTQQVDCVPNWQSPQKCTLQTCIVAVELEATFHAHIHAYCQFNPSRCARTAGGNWCNIRRNPWRHGGQHAHLTQKGPSWPADSNQEPSCSTRMSVLQYLVITKHKSRCFTLSHSSSLFLPDATWSYLLF